LARKKLAEENWNLRRIDNEIVKVIEKLNVWHPYSGKLATEDEINWKVKEVLEHIALEKEIDSMEMDEEDVEFEDWELSENEEAAMAELEKTVYEELAITKNALLADEDIEMVDQFQCQEVEGMEYEEWLREELRELDIEMTTNDYELWQKARKSSLMEENLDHIQRLPLLETVEEIELYNLEDQKHHYL
jgi:predicted DNA binding CopG/RHH family protein